MYCILYFKLQKLVVTHLTEIAQSTDSTYNDIIQNVPLMLKQIVKTMANLSLLQTHNETPLKCPPNHSLCCSYGIHCVLYKQQIFNTTKHLEINESLSGCRSLNHTVRYF